MFHLFFVASLTCHFFLHFVNLEAAHLAVTENVATADRKTSVDVSSPMNVPSSKFGFVKFSGQLEKINTPRTYEDGKKEFTLKEHRFIQRKYKDKREKVDNDKVNLFIKKNTNFINPFYDNHSENLRNYSEKENVENLDKYRNLLNKENNKITLLQLENESKESMLKQFKENQRKSRPYVIIHTNKLFIPNHHFVKRNSIMNDTSDERYSNKIGTYLNACRGRKLMKEGKMHTFAKSQYIKHPEFMARFNNISSPFEFQFSIGKRGPCQERLKTKNDDLNLQRLNKGVIRYLRSRGQKKFYLDNKPLQQAKSEQWMGPTSILRKLKRLKTRNVAMRNRNPNKRQQNQVNDDYYNNTVLAKRFYNQQIHEYKNFPPINLFNEQNSDLENGNGKFGKSKNILQKYNVPFKIAFPQNADLKNQAPKNVYQIENKYIENNPKYQNLEIVEELTPVYPIADSRICEATTSQSKCTLPTKRCNTTRVCSFIISTDVYIDEIIKLRK